MSYVAVNAWTRRIGIAVAAATLASCTVSSTTLRETDAGQTSVSEPASSEPARNYALDTTTSPPTDPPPLAAPAPPEPIETPPPPAPPTAPPTAPPETSVPLPAALTPVPDDVHDADCVVRASAPGSLELFAATQPAVEPEPDALLGLWIENGFADDIERDALVDVCIGNGVDDIDGTAVPGPDDPAVADARRANIVRQQRRLNELFAPVAPRNLDVDGISGPRTGQRLCGARLALGIDASIADMVPGSQEQAVLFDADALTNPASNATQSERWILIDRTCQLMFVGAGPDLTHVFNTSTGSTGFETRLQDRADAFRFNPAVENGGWHDSSEFPVGVDNPLNGNMYKPLYFDLGQAIHGANSVPPVPDSKGCARLGVSDHDTLVRWLGLTDVQEETWRKNEMNVTITVQGEFIER